MKKDLQKRTKGAKAEASLSLLPSVESQERSARSDGPYLMKRDESDRQLYLVLLAIGIAAALASCWEGRW